LCEDNLVNQKVALRLLQQTGYRADIAASGFEALSALDRQPYDLIFMDIQMPEMDGLTATRTIRERQKQKTRFPNYKSPIIIVAMTASAMLGDREKCLAVGMDDYLAKPIRPEDVRRILERWGPTAIGDEHLQATTPGAEPTVNKKMKDSKTTSSVPAAEPAPVNLERLMEFSEGTEESLRELIALYLKQTAEQLDQIGRALSASDADAVWRVAHSCAGASATCGMSGMVKVLREMERQSHEGRLTAVPQLLEQARREFGRIRDFLANEENIRRALSLSVST
jgi:CheY-like chemotaxis protein